MSIKGLEVKGLDSTGISQKLEIYVSNYFEGYSLGAGQSMFMEGHMFYFDEVSGIIPAEHHHLFTDESKFNGMSGYVIVGHVEGKADERIISVLMDEQNDYVYLLCLQETGEQGEVQPTIIKDFLSA